MNSYSRISQTVAGLRVVISIVVTSSIAVVVQMNAGRFALVSIPSKHQPPLLVDADGMEAIEIAFQRLEIITRRHTQVLIGRCIVDHLKSAKQTAFEIRRNIAGMNVIHEKNRQMTTPRWPIET